MDVRRIVLDDRVRGPSRQEIPHAPREDEAVPVMREEWRQRELDEQGAEVSARSRGHQRGTISSQSKAAESVRASELWGSCSIGASAYVKSKRSSFLPSFHAVAATRRAQTMGSSPRAR